VSTWGKAKASPKPKRMPAVARGSPWPTTSLRMSLG
jgi:hypothetical protein